jgi:citronellyl-CoA dehydrogenase
MFTEEHDAFRAMVRGFVQNDVDPYVDAWEEARILPAHELFPKLAKQGLLGLEYDTAHGGQGVDHSYTVVLMEELGRIAAGGVPMAIQVQTDMATPSLAQFGSEELRQRWLSPALAGEMVCSIAVSEPDAGSDVAGIRTHAVRDGDDWVINGAKTWITNGTQADWLCLLVRTSDEGGYAGMSQIVFPTDTPGFRVDRAIEKMGMHSSDTASLSFTDCRVPVTNTIGTVGRGFQQQMAQFVKERMVVNYSAIGGAELAIERTARYLRERVVFGQPLLQHQHLQMRLAELVAELDLLRQYNYTVAEAYRRGEDATWMASVAKLKSGRLVRQIADECVQMHGGMGYAEDLWVARYFRDSRLGSIGGGADEVMLRTLARMSGWPTSP